METNKKIRDDVRLKLEEMIEKRYEFNEISHDEFLRASTGFPIINLIEMTMVRSDRKKYYTNFQIDLKLLCDRFGVGQDEIKTCLLEMLEEARSAQNGGIEQMIVNVLYELGMSMGKIVDKRAHNSDYALKPKKVSKIWRANFNIVDESKNTSDNTIL